MSTSRDDSAPDAGADLLRIGEMGRRLNVSPEVLRAWERRYGLFDPDRSPGGFRLYTAVDQRRARSMVARIAGGMAPAEAARRILEDPAPPPESDGGDQFAALRESLETLDGGGAGEAFERLSRTMGLESLVGHVVMPVMRDLGEMWEMGTVTTAQEHFFSSFFRRRLMALADDWEGGERRVILACAPEEQHDLPLICLGLALNSRSWGVTYLGPRTPAASLLEADQRCSADAIVLSCTVNDGLDDGLTAIAARLPTTPIYLLGGAASPARAAQLSSPEIPSRNPVAVARWIDENAAG